MQTLKEVIDEAQKNRVAVGHFNISDLAALKAIFQTAKDLNLPVIIGVSEGEREFLGVKTVSAIIHLLRKEFHFPIFLNADHTHSLEGVKEAVEAGFDSVIFDGSKLSFEENVQQTKEAVQYVKSKNPGILVEGELGYIGSSSQVFNAIPKGVLFKESDLPTPKEAKRFVEETSVDLFAPAVGNIHGMLTYKEPPLHIARIEEIKNAVQVPLVLHGGSGSADGEVLKAIEAGVSVIHINTEIRKAWRQGIEQALKDQPDEVAPYHLLAPSVAKIQEVVQARLKLFSHLLYS